VGVSAGATREPERLNRQVHPETVRILNSKNEDAKRPAVPSSLNPTSAGSP
jgi:hypothetical protein